KTSGSGCPTPERSAGVAHERSDWFTGRTPASEIPPPPVNNASGFVHRMVEVPFAGVTLDALESLYRSDLPRFVRAAAAIAGDEGAGRDAVQEAFAQAVTKRKSFKHEAPLEAWVWRIVINEALALRRKSIRQHGRDWEHGASLPASHEPEQD